MILKKLLLNLFICFILADEDCSSFFDPNFQQQFSTVNEQQQLLKETRGIFVHYNINKDTYPELSKYFELVVQQIRDKEDYVESRNIAKYLKKLNEIDKFGRFFPIYCSYYEKETLNQKKSYFIVEQGGQSLAELQKQGGNKLLSFLEKFVIMKKIAKAVSILHIYNFLLCKLDMQSFKVYLEDKQYDDELLTEQFQAQNLKYEKFSSLIENVNEQNCPIIKNYKGNESPELIQRQILFDDIEKKFKQRSDVYQMAFIFIQLFLSTEEYEELNNLTLTRTAQNVKEVNEQIQKKVIELLNEVKQTQIDQSYQLSFDYFIQVILRMLQFNPSDRLAAYDVFQGFIIIIENKLNQNVFDKIKTASELRFDQQLAENVYSPEQIIEIQQQQQGMETLVDKIYLENDLSEKNNKTVDDTNINYKMKNLPDIEKNEQKKKQNSI